MASPSSGDDAQPHSDSDISRQLYSCDICHAKLSRRAHLERHRLVHCTNPPKSFLCTLCDKRFTRNDVYLRHKRGVHGTSQKSPKICRRRSCKRCIRYKLKCTRRVPCAACSERGVQCIFDSAHCGPVEAPADAPSVALPGPELDLPPLAEIIGNDRNDGPDPSPPDTYPSFEPQQMDTFGDEYQSQPHNWEGSHPSAFLDPPAAYPLVATVDGNSPYQADRRSSEQINNEPLSSVDFEDIDWNIFRSSRIDWLGCETDLSDRQTLPPDEVPSDSLQPSATLQQEGSDPIPPMDTMIEDPSLVLDLYRTFQTRQSSNDRDGEETWPGILDRGGNETWPFDYTSNKGFRKIKLPPLRQVLEQTVGDRPAIEKNTLMDLIKVLSAPRIPSLNDGPTLEALPAATFLGRFIKIYFAEFHTVLPIIHLPTFRIEKCPTALLAATACIGATYSTAEGSQEVSALLAEITQRALFWTGQADSTAFRDPAYVTASCLHQIYSLGSGNRRLYEIADASRGLLLTSLRGLGVLASHAERGEVNGANPNDLRKMEASTLEATWLRWSEKEMEKRLAWSVFEYDCTLSTLTSKRGAFNVAELPARLPCIESLWEAHSAQAWASMISLTTSPPAGLLFYPLLRDFLAGKADLNSVPAWGKRICAQVVGRMLWDLREIEDTTSPDVLGLPSLAASHQSTKLTLLKSLNGVHDSLSQPTCTSDIVNMNIGCLIMHYSNLTHGHEAMDLVVYLFRNSGREDVASSSKRLAIAKEHLCYIFARNPIETRQMVYHAAATVVIARECTIYTPCETMRVFMGFAFLLAFTRYFPFQEGNVVQDEGQLPVKLDELPWKRSRGEEARVERWVRFGGEATLEMVGDICDVRNFDGLKQSALRTLQDLRVWGLAGKFYRTIRNFE